MPNHNGLNLEPAEQKLYKLIWERFVASQMVPARISRRTVEAETGNENSYLFRATSSDILFPGYMQASGIEEAEDRKKQDDEEDGLIPPLELNESLDVIDWLTEEKETKPVARYSEASLIKALEENGVGRPSTYAAIMSKLDEREYVEKVKRSLMPTELGRELVGLVKRTEMKLKTGNKTDLFEVNFTANMEARLDEVEAGRVEWTQMMESFYPSLLEWIEHAKETADPQWVARCLEALSNVREWSEPVKTTKRTYDDQKTFMDIKETTDSGELLSKRQGEMLFKMCCRYYHQIPDSYIKELELKEPEAVREDTSYKLSLLKDIVFEKPTKVGKRVYDDSKFVKSLGEQVTMEKRLSDRQIAYLDSLLGKYADQIDNFEEIKANLKLGEKIKVDADPTTAPILEMLDKITNWAEPTKRGKREFNDKSFYESLASQFKSKGALSERQLAALKKMAARYAEQLPNYLDLQDELGLPAPRKVKESKTENGD